MSVSGASLAHCGTAQDDIVIARCDDLETFLGKAIDRNVEKERSIVASVRPGEFFQFGTNELHSADGAYDPSRSFSVARLPETKRPLHTTNCES